MPFDGNPEQFDKPRTADLTVRGLRDWLLRQPNLDAAYCYTDIGDCLLHRYLVAQGIFLRHVGPCFFRTVNDELVSYPYTMNDIAVGRLPGGKSHMVGDPARHTYRAALARCEAFLKEGAE